MPNAATPRTRKTEIATSAPSPNLLPSASASLLPFAAVAKLTTPTRCSIRQVACLPVSTTPAPIRVVAMAPALSRVQFLARVVVLRALSDSANEARQWQPAPPAIQLQSFPTPAPEPPRSQIG